MGPLGDFTGPLHIGVQKILFGNCQLSIHCSNKLIVETTITDDHNRNNQC